HPEVFDRLYEDWTTIEGFQRTRGVLKLMAKVIHRLWKSGNKDYLILPGSLPLADGPTRNEFTAYLPAGWDPVIERDVDGERAETTELESAEPRFGQVEAARRVARTLFLGSAPSSVAGQPGNRGLDTARVLLGCLQPGQSAATFTDALHRLGDRLHYLNITGDRGSDSARYWFDTRANLRREMEDRKRRFDQGTDVLSAEREAVRQTLKGNTLFGGVHVFTEHADIPDDATLRLVVLPPERWYAKAEPRLAEECVLETLRSNGAKPRHRANRLLFLAADTGVSGRLHDAARTMLAWQSIVDDIRDGKLNVDQHQKKAADVELEKARQVLPRTARECYRWLLCPAQHTPTDPRIELEALQLATSGGAMGAELERVCLEHELVVPTWSPVHLKARLGELYWKADRPAVPALSFWEDSLRYLYLPRLKDRDVFASAVAAGARTRDFFGIAYGDRDGKFEGFELGATNVSVDDTLLLIEPAAAAAYAQRQAELAAAAAAANSSTAPGLTATVSGTATATADLTSSGAPVAPAARVYREYLGTAKIAPASAKMQLVQLADELIALLASDPTAQVSVALEIRAEFPNGASEKMVRDVRENASHLKVGGAGWE
nr:hypothetical protein [Gemmatimonadaceae bacterium]